MAHFTEMSRGETMWTRRKIRTSAAPPLSELLAQRLKFVEQHLVPLALQNLNLACETAALQLFFVLGQGASLGRCL